MGSLTYTAVRGADTAYSKPRSLEAFVWTIVLSLIVALTLWALVVGVTETLNIQDNTYYDKELNRTVYAETGV